MNKEQTHAEQILAKVQYVLKSRVYFMHYDRSPQFGIFVELDGHEEMLEKGYLRFVSESKMRDWEALVNEGASDAKLKMLTRLFTLSEIRDIQTYKY